jgi:hypothetical protein
MYREGERKRRRREKEVSMLHDWKKERREKPVTMYSRLGVVGVTSKREQRHEPRFATPPHLVPISIVRHSRK